VHRASSALGSLFLSISVSLRLSYAYVGGIYPCLLPALRADLPRRVAWRTLRRGAMRTCF